MNPMVWVKGEERSFDPVHLIPRSLTHAQEPLLTAVFRATLLNVALALVPRVVMAVMQTTTIRASITAYSTAVGPSSCRRNARTACRLKMDAIRIANDFLYGLGGPSAITKSSQERAREVARRMKTARSVSTIPSSIPIARFG